MDDIDLNDWHNNSHETFAGCYGELIQRLKEIQPDAKFFLVTMPRESEDEWRRTVKEQQQKLFYEMANVFSNTYVIDLFQYAPCYDEEFKKNFYLLGHMNPMGYIFTAKMMASYIDYIIRHNPDDFHTAGFINTGLLG